MPGQSNGWQAGFTALLGFGIGFSWDAATGAKSTAVSGGFNPDVEVNVSEYARTWTEMGKEVPCAEMVWGTGWDKL